ncbi:hypothetical protein PPERSA_11427 [Pseudocohnilembus persalinus]|uniref:EXS domain-containing protein n=1 Tax=Pseudocohnilembus persalinus TaxID=266149 RepID=A0A0V0QPM1_PSEPJ|nr:hypothetical protein PPERSA_11427 [Pseudocohnilembus persalinus]|eukprot:KRX04303.1 hypothetical protein PPERSA_11427 [Pseudocohnilembus persalinus]
MSVEIVVFPYLLRFFQCIRQGFDQNKYFNSTPFYNSIKYLSSIFAIIVAYLVNNYSKDLTYLWFIAALITTLYSYYWDLFQDWKIWEIVKNKRNRIPTYQYIIIAIINLFLRFTWIMTICHGEDDQVCTNREVLKFFIYLGEIIRRQLWAHLRLEKEQIYTNIEPMQPQLFKINNQSDLNEFVTQSTDANIQNVWYQRQNLSQSEADSLIFCQKKSQGQNQRKKNINELNTLIDKRNFQSQQQDCIVEMM